MLWVMAGAAIVPVYHRAYSAACPCENSGVNKRSHPATPVHHDHEKCLICQMAATQMETASPLIVPSAAVSLLGALPIVRASIPYSEPLGISLARGPPVHIS